MPDLRKIASILIILSSLVYGKAQANSRCVGPYRIPDLNCDGDFTLAILGDSFVAGVGDSENRNKGGYVLRTAKKLKRAKVVGFGESGQEARQLLLKLQRAFRRLPANPGSLVSALLSADAVVLDIGRNDRWLFGEPAGTYRNLKRIVRLITNRAKEYTGSSPLVVTAVMMLPNRGSQGPWVAELNKLIAKGHSFKYPADLRFDTVSKRLLQPDQLHPSPAGYEGLTEVLVKYVKKRLPRHMKRYLRKRG